jgi:serine/threonine protein kinase
MDHEVTIFEQALALGSPQEREAYLREACAGDAAMLERLHGLLLAHGLAGGFLEHQRPPPAAGQPNEPSLDSTPGSNPPLPGKETCGNRIGRFKLLQQIGEGGCGVVYMAEQEEPVRRRVALKVIKLGMYTRQVIARFEAERQALALMDHPNIAKVLDAGATDTGRPYFVMDLVKGVPITRYCDENMLTAEQRLRLFIQVCQAVQHAHQKGVIHRDLKPSNILVADHDGTPVPKIIDFGIAKATTDQRLTDKTLFTAFEQFIGTPAYMSPEQAKLSGLDVDTRSDIYSLGVLLYELLTGKTPFDPKRLLEAGLDEIRRTIQEMQPIPPSTRLSTMSQEELTTTAHHRGAEPPRLINLVRGDLDWIVMKCLEKDRARRYDTANGLATDLACHLNNEPIVARPQSRFYRFQKTVQRNKLALGAAAAVALALVIGFVVSMAMFLKERAARERTETAEKEQARLRQQAERMPILLFTGLDSREKNHLPEAEAAYRQALSLARELYGNDHIEVAYTLCFLGSTLARQGKFAEAEPFYREALAISKKLLHSPEQHLANMMTDDSFRLSVPSLMQELADTLSGQGKLAEAETLRRGARIFVETNSTAKRE